MADTVLQLTIVRGRWVGGVAMWIVCAPTAIALRKRSVHSVTTSLSSDLNTYTFVDDSCQGFHRYIDIMALFINDVSMVDSWVI